VAEAHNLRLNPVTRPSRQQHTIANADVAGQTIDIDDQPGHPGNSSFDVHRGDVSEPGSASRDSLLDSRLSHCWLAISENDPTNTNKRQIHSPIIDSQ
jgi:hypothetical protein